MKIALIQTNPVIGDFPANSAKILHWTGQARKKGCRLAIFPELSLCGYPPQDLLERGDFIAAHENALHALLPQLSGIGVILGVIEPRSGSGKPLYNSAVLIDKGTERARARKQLLPAYDVFDETRYFEPGSASTVAVLDDLRLGLTVCEDIWYEDGSYARDPVEGLFVHGGPGPDLLVNISASPFHHGKLNERRKILSSLCRHHRLPLVYVNQVGGQDSLIFDGHSMIISPEGNHCAGAVGFEEDMVVVDTAGFRSTGYHDPPQDSIDTVLNALVLGVRDYMHKTGFRKAVLGSSGGIDSAVTAVIACMALGAENVLTVALPSPYTSQASTGDARRLAANLGCGFESLPIARAMQAYRETLAPLFAGLEEDVTEQNIQARIRGNLLMALSNKFGHLLLSTGNKSEMAVGYCTLYGDMSGGLAVLADVPKQMVYALARAVNRDREIIPERIISRPPTAELKPGQLDLDDLPSYDVLDAILQAYLEEQLSAGEIEARGFARPVVEDIIKRVKLNEYKRRQAAVGLRVTTKAFGPGRRYPIVQNFKG
jgi:NAD+ synthase (glutamine-hydrolysing)